MNKESRSPVSSHAKLFSKMHFVLISLLIVTILPACVPQSASNQPSPTQQEISIFIQVIDGSTQNPISGIAVTLEPHGETPKTQYTEIGGYTRFNLNLKTPTLNAMITAIDPNSNYATDNLTIETSQNNTYNIKLRKIEQDRTPQVYFTPLPKDISGKIAFQRDNAFIVADLNGSNEVKISDYPVLCPRISPDGKRIAFVLMGHFKTDLYIVNHDGSGLTNLSDTIGSEENCASWSPDSIKLLYGREYSIDNDLFIMNSDGSNQKNLTQNNLQGILARHMWTASPWSPDGSQILFASDQEGLWHIFKVNVNGINPVRIMPDSTSADYGAVWSSTESFIAFVSTGGVGGETDIYVLNLDDVQVQPVNLTNDPAHDTDPAWSPNSKQILFISDRDGNREVYVMNSDGTNVKKITNTPEDEQNPYWIP